MGWSAGHWPPPDSRAGFCFPAPGGATLRGVQTPLNFAIDFDAIRAALVAAAMQACALEQGRVGVAEPEVGGCRPGKPYVTIKVMTPAARYASDSLDVGE